MNVVTPATTSVRTVVPCSFRQNHRSNNDPSAAALCAARPMRAPSPANTNVLANVHLFSWCIFRLQSVSSCSYFKNTSGKSAFSPEPPGTSVLPLFCPQGIDTAAGLDIVVTGSTLTHRVLTIPKDATIEGGKAS